jgi:hypothetical protein
LAESCERKKKLGGNAGGEGRVEIGLAGGFFHNDVSVIKS